MNDLLFKMVYSRRKGIIFYSSMYLTNTLATLQMLIISTCNKFKTRRALYMEYVNSILTYVSVVWNPQSLVLLIKLEGI